MRSGAIRRRYRWSLAWSFRVRLDHVETFISFLDFWRSYYYDQEPLSLVLDCSSVHHTENMRKQTDKLGIHLSFIPAGMTDAYQPLDPYIFEIMKAKDWIVSRNVMLNSLYRPGFIDSTLCLFRYRNCVSEFWLNRIGPASGQRWNQLCASACRHQLQNQLCVNNDI
jgi:hypothetical protein